MNQSNELRDEMGMIMPRFLKGGRNAITEPNELRNKIAQQWSDALKLDASVGETDVMIYFINALNRYAEELVHREDFADGRDHLTVSGTFQSDKYSWCPAGFVPLKLSDSAARDLLEEYARRREVIDKEFPRDLLEALKNTPEKKNAGYKPFISICDIEGLKTKMAKAREALEASDSLIVEAQRLLTEYLKSDGAGMEVTIGMLLGLLDGEEQREVRKVTRKVLKEIGGE